MHLPLSILVIAAAIICTTATPLANTINPRQSYIPFCTGPSCAWNSNMMIVPNTIANQYPYILSFQNVASTPPETYQIKCFNAYSPDGTRTGSFTSGQPTVDFLLSAGETKTLPVKPDTTAAACAWVPGTSTSPSSSFPTTPWSQYAGVWAEFAFGVEANGGSSEAVCSALVAASAGLDVPGCRISRGGSDSTIWPGGTTGSNAYYPGVENYDYVGLFVFYGNVTFQVEVGFS